MNSSLDELHKKPSNDISSTSDGVIPSNLFKSTTRKPLRKLPNHSINTETRKLPSTGKSVNAQDLESAKLNLREFSTSSSSKWMKPKGTSPPRVDLQSVLQKQLGDMR